MPYDQVRGSQHLAGSRARLVVSAVLTAALVCSGVATTSGFAAAAVDARLARPSSVVGRTVAAAPAVIEPAPKVPARFRPLTTATVGPTTTTTRAGAHGSTGKGPKGAHSKAHKPAPPPVQVPNPGTGALLVAVISDERQMASLIAYADAESYLREAKALSVAAGDRVDTALVVLAAAQEKEHLAVLAEAAANRMVELYEQALYELGIAEYTGRTAQVGNDLQALEHQVVVSQLGQVAARDTTDGLHQAQSDLMASKRHLKETRAVVAAKWWGVGGARHRLVQAQTQVGTSHQALLVARQWATVPGRAPARPAIVLATFEGGLAPHRLGAHRPTHLALEAGPFSPARQGAVASPTTVTAAPTTITAVPTSVTSVESSGGTTVVARAAKASGRTSPTVPLPDMRTGGPTILGPSLLTAAQIAAWFKSTGAVANASVPIDELIVDYMKAGQFTGVRADLSFAQSVVETGYFAFPAFGQDPARYNNFAGIGACDSCKHGFKFGSALDGVLAQQYLLSQYATPVVMGGPESATAAEVGVAGCCQTWMALSGVWATNINYGFAILSVYKEMLDSALQGELQKVGLATVSPGLPSSLASATAPAANQPVKSSPAPSRSPPT